MVIRPLPGNIPDTMGVGQMTESVVPCLYHPVETEQSA